MPKTYYDDNYGKWHDTDDPEVVEFYHKTQRKNVRKKCIMCKRMVNIQPQYDKCGQCADMIEGVG